MFRRLTHPTFWLAAGPMIVTLLSASLPRLPFGPLRALGVPLMFAGVGGRLYCTGFLLRSGSSPDPEQPPDRLTKDGPYAVSRNPMLVSDLVLLAGATLATTSPLLAAYTAAVFSALNRYIRQVEELALRELFGAEYDDYAARTARWLRNI